MAALLAGARLVLRQGARLLPVYTRRASAVPVRCLSGSSRLFTVMAQDEQNAEAEFDPIWPATAESKTLSIELLGLKLKKNGHIHRHTLLDSFNSICNTGKPSTNEAWFLLRVCGLYMPDVLPAVRIETVNDMWNKLKELDVELTITLYNTLLNIYIQNEHEFSITDFLANMEAANVAPDQVTYEGFIAAYCNAGDLDGASKILCFMKTKNFPVTEGVFNSLIKGHARAGDMKSANNILTTMQSSGINPSRHTHLALLTAYAESGDIENIRQILNDSSKNVLQKQLISVIMALAKSGYPQYVADVTEHMPNCLQFSEAIMNLCVSLLTQGYEDAALVVVKLLNSWKPLNKDSQPGDFFIRHCINMKMPLSVLNKVAVQLLASEMHNRPKEFMLYCAVKRNNLDLAMELMINMKHQGTRVKFSCFRHTVDYLQNKNDVQGIIQLLMKVKMYVDFDLDMVSKCMQCIFSKDNADEPFLQDKECMENIENVCLTALTRAIYHGQLHKVENFLLSWNAHISRGKRLTQSLALAFLKQTDVKTMAKITSLLFKDDSGSKASLTSDSKTFAHFLYYLITKLSDSDAQTKAEQLREYLHQLAEMGLTMTQHQSEGIKNILHFKGLLKLFESVKKFVKEDAYLLNPSNIAYLEEALAKLERGDQQMISVVQKLLHVLRKTKDLPKALELKSKYEDCFTFGMYMELLDLCCEQNNVQEVVQLKKEIDKKRFPDTPSLWKYLRLLNILTENGLIQDAVNVLMEMQEKDVHTDGNDSYLLMILNNMALKGDVQALNYFHEYGVMMGLINPNWKMCAPLVLIHLKKDDLPAAIDAIYQCTEKYKCTPLVHDVLSLLVERGETDLIKKVVDNLSNTQGEQAMFHELFFAFIKTGKYSEAEKIIETPGLRAMPGKISWFTNQCVELKQVEMLEKCVEISKKLYGCARKEMYSRLFMLYDNNNDLEKAKHAWYTMREEDIVDSESLNILHRLFKRHGKDVNVDIPEISSLTFARQLEGTSKPVDAPDKSIRSLCEERNTTEAFAKFQSLKQRNIQVRMKTSRHLKRELLLNGLFQEAAEVDDSINQSRGVASRRSNFADQVRQNCLKDALVTLEALLKKNIKPQIKVVSRLLETLTLNGDMPGVEKIKELTAFPLLPAESLSWNLNVCVALAHLKNGNIEEGISMLEDIYVNKKTNAGFLVAELIKSNMKEALEKLTILAERMANQFAIYSPVTDLFLNFFKMERDEEAIQLLQKYSAIEEQGAQLLGFISKWHKFKIIGKEERINRFVELLSDPFYKQYLYSVKMKEYVYMQAPVAAIALYEEAKAKNIELHELTLKELAVLLRITGESIPFPEPPETIDYYEKQWDEKKLQYAEEKKEQD